MKLTDLAKHGWDWNKAVEQPHACFCVGPQNGEAECPCAIRNKRGKKHAEWLQGFEAGLKVGRAQKK